MNKNNRFLIHCHNAEKVGLHYDLRLERDGVLKSFATRYLPQLIDNEKKKILLIQVYDHKLEWFNFEGQIFKGYGKGNMYIWDKGTYKTVKWTKSNIIVEFDGQKLIGKYSLIPYKDKPDQWLMYPVV